MNNKLIEIKEKYSSSNILDLKIDIPLSKSTLIEFVTDENENLLQIDTFSKKVITDEEYDNSPEGENDYVDITYNNSTINIKRENSSIMYELFLIFHTINKIKNTSPEKTDEDHAYFNNMIRKFAFNTEYEDIVSHSIGEMNDVINAIIGSKKITINEEKAALHTTLTFLQQTDEDAFVKFILLKARDKKPILFGGNSQEEVIDMVNHLKHIDYEIIFTDPHRKLNLNIANKYMYFFDRDADCYYMFPEKTYNQYLEETNGKHK